MKKQMKKLVLAKETLRDLEKLTLSKMAGGTGSDNACTNTACTYYNSCQKYCYEEYITAQAC